MNQRRLLGSSVVLLLGFGGSFATVPIHASPGVVARPVQEAWPRHQGEKVPDAGVVNGEPRGMFVGRSLLTGRAVCLLFLSGGRATRFIPTGGLEAFDWVRHRTEHEPNSGTWEKRGDLLRINWGDGGVHEGPLKVTESGIEFYGKRYSRPVGVTVGQLAGQWESARGTAITGGEGINTITNLMIEADGRYRWSGTTGGEVAGRAAASVVSRSGRLSIVGSTMTLTADDATIVARTLVAVSGTPVSAFSLDADLFTRVK